MSEYVVPTSTIGGKETVVHEGQHMTREQYYLITEEKRKLENTIPIMKGAEAVAERANQGKDPNPPIVSKGDKAKYIEETEEVTLYAIRRETQIKSRDEQYSKYIPDDFRAGLLDLEGKPEVTANIRIIRPLTEGEAEGQAPKESQWEVVGKPFVELLAPYTEFFLQGVREVDKEKAQIIETFGEFYVNFFGRSPRIYTFNGGLLNTKHHDWRNEFLEKYETQLRGTKLAEQNAKVYITYQDTLVEGYPLHCTTDILVQNPNVVPFSMMMVVTNRTSLKRRIAPTREVVEAGLLKYSEVPDDVFKVVQNHLQFDGPLYLAHITEE